MWWYWRDGYVPFLRTISISFKLSSEHAEHQSCLPLISRRICGNVLIVSKLCPSFFFYPDCEELIPSQTLKSSKLWDKRVREGGITSSQTGYVKCKNFMLEFTLKTCELCKSILGLCRNYTPRTLNFIQTVLLRVRGVQFLRNLGKSFFTRVPACQILRWYDTSQYVVCWKR